jgi:hypothetical protein
MPRRKREPGFSPELNPQSPDSKITELYDLIVRQQLEASDAVIWLEGDVDDRVAKCIELIQRNYAPTIVLSGGNPQPEVGAIPSWDMKKTFLDAGIPEEKIVLEDQSKHTKQQAENVLRIAQERGWTKIILVASPYHQIRAFLTFLAELQKIGLADRIKMMNAPADVSWFREVSGRGREAVDLFTQEESPRIQEYQEKGDVAQVEEGIAYLQHWKESKDSTNPHLNTLIV